MKMETKNKAKCNTKKMPITTIDLDLTNDCVLACDYCFRGEKNKRRLTLERGKKAIDWFIKESGSQIGLQRGNGRLVNQTVWVVTSTETLTLTVALQEVMYMVSILMVTMMN